MNNNNATGPNWSFPKGINPITKNSRYIQYLLPCCHFKWLYNHRESNGNRIISLLYEIEVEPEGMHIWIAKHVDIKHAMVLGTIFINDRYNKTKEMHITDKVAILAVK